MHCQCTRTYCSFSSFCSDRLWCGFLSIAMSFHLSAFGPGVIVAGGTILFLLSWSCLRHSHGDKSIQRYPPSPPTDTISGHHHLPTEKCVSLSQCVVDPALNFHRPFLTVASWIEQYGPLIFLRSGTYRYMVIGRHQASMFMGVVAYTCPLTEH